MDRETAQSAFEKPPDQATILVVDNASHNSDALLESLRRQNYAVTATHDGESAFEIIKRVSPDLILLDVMMPGISGFEICRQLKANALSKDIPIIFVDAKADPADEVKGLELGSVDYITGPVQIETALARIRARLLQRNIQKSLEKQNIQLKQEIAEYIQTQQKLQNENRELETFSRVVAHDVKAPIATATSYAEYLANHFYEFNLAHIFQMIKSIEQSLRTGVNIVDEVLLMATLQQHKIEINPLDMIDIVDRAQNRLAPVITKHQAEIILPNIWPVVQGSAQWIEQVWVNYISNGLKYGGRPPRLELGATRQPGGMTRLWVHDNGAGISPEAQARLFTEFVRLEDVKVEGHGLGLSIVRWIVEKLGGEVGIESKVGKGSTFFFTLPNAE